MTEPVSAKQRTASTPLIRGMDQEWPPAVAWFAWFGAAVLAVALWSMGSWILSDNFHPTPLGAHPDPLPGYVLPAIWIFEIANVLGFLWVIWFCIKTSRRDGRLSLEAVLAISWALQYWQDPLILWLQPTFFFNGYVTNLSSWSPYIPGWINQSSKGWPDPLLFQGLAYTYYFLLVSLAVAWAMRQTKLLRPHWGVMRLLAAGLLVSVTMDLVFEVIFIRTQLMAYPKAIYALSLWPGQTYQYPLYNALFWGIVQATTGFLYYFRDDRGNTLVERGIERIKAVRLHAPIRVLAMFGFVSIFIGAYTVLTILISLNADPMPLGYPSWLLNGACEAGTPYPCVGSAGAPPLVTQ